MCPWHFKGEARPDNANCLPPPQPRRPHGRCVVGQKCAMLQNGPRAPWRATVVSYRLLGVFGISDISMGKKSNTILWQNALNFAMVCYDHDLSLVILKNCSTRWISVCSSCREFQQQRGSAAFCSSKTPSPCEGVGILQGPKRPNLRKTGHGRTPTTTADGNSFAMQQSRSWTY